MGTTNRNAPRSPIKRKASRSSLPTFNAVDFDYSGNTSNVADLIKHKTKGDHGSSPAGLDFELNLRSYVNRTNFNSQAPFIYPKPVKANPVGWDKSSFGEAVRV